MSVFLIALGGVARCPGRRSQNATGWLVAAGVVLALANVTAYSSVLFDVAVLLLALLIALPELEPGRPLGVASRYSSSWWCC